MYNLFALELWAKKPSAGELGEALEKEVKSNNKNRAVSPRSSSKHYLSQEISWTAVLISKPNFIDQCPFGRYLILTFWFRHTPSTVSELNSQTPVWLQSSLFHLSSDSTSKFCPSLPVTKSKKKGYLLINTTFINVPRSVPDAGDSDPGSLVRRKVFK